jgi:hypothetical protein
MVYLGQGNVVISKNYVFQRRNALIDPKLHDPKDDRTRRSHLMIATALGLGVADIENINHVKIRLA